MLEQYCFGIFVPNKQILFNIGSPTHVFSFHSNEGENKQKKYTCTCTYDTETTNISKRKKISAETPPPQVVKHAST